MSILEEPAGRGKPDVEPEGKKVALSSFPVSAAKKCFLGVWSTATPGHRDTVTPRLLSAHWGVLLPRTEHRSLFPLYGRSFLRHLKLSTIVYRANYFIFIVNLSEEELISKIRLKRIYMYDSGKLGPIPLSEAPACRGRPCRVAPPPPLGKSVRTGTPRDAPRGGKGRPSILPPGAQREHFRSHCPGRSRGLWEDAFPE